MNNEQRKKNEIQNNKRKGVKGGKGEKKIKIKIKKKN